MKKNFQDFFQKMKCRSALEPHDTRNVYESILNNLERILHSTQVSDDFTGNYGVPDFTQYFYTEFKTEQDLMNAIHNSIHLHENRLKNVQIEVENSNRDSAEMQVTIKSEIHLPQKINHFELRYAPITKKCRDYFHENTY